jgi:hypothetical protein
MTGRYLFIVGLRGVSHCVGRPSEDLTAAQVNVTLANTAAGAIPTAKKSQFPTA